MCWWQRFNAEGVAEFFKKKQKRPHKPYDTTGHNAYNNTYPFFSIFRWFCSQASLQFFSGLSQGSRSYLVSRRNGSWVLPNNPVWVASGPQSAATLFQHFHLIRPLDTCNFGAQFGIHGSRF